MMYKMIIARSASSSKKWFVLIYCGPLEYVLDVRQNFPHLGRQWLSCQCAGEVSWKVRLKSYLLFQTDNFESLLSTRRRPSCCLGDHLSSWTIIKLKTIKCSSRGPLDSIKNSITIEYLPIPLTG